MKKNKFLNCIVLLIIYLFIANIAYAEEKKYVFIDIDSIDGEIGYPGLVYKEGFDLTSKCSDENHNTSCITNYTPYYFTKKECLTTAKKYMKEWKKLNKEDLFTPERKKYYYKMIDKYYVAQYNPENIFNFFCIPVDMWNEMNSPHKNSKYDINIETIYRTNESFAKVMKKCGFNTFDYNHINLHDTPFICDKYNENNPIPTATYDEILTRKK